MDVNDFKSKVVAPTYSDGIGFDCVTILGVLDINVALGLGFVTRQYEVQVTRNEAATKEFILPPSYFVELLLLRVMNEDDRYTVCLSKLLQPVI